jgi:hypothetical protein
VVGAGLSSRRRRVLAVEVVVALVLLPTALAPLTRRAVPAPAAYQERIALPPGGKLVFRASLSESFLDGLRAETAREDALAFYLPVSFFMNSFPEPVALDVSVTAGAAPVPVAPVPAGRYGVPHIWRAREAPAALRTLAAAREVTVEVVNRGARTVRLGGWQRRDLPGRSVDLVHPTLAPGACPPAAAYDLRYGVSATMLREATADGSAVLPAVEVRLLRPDTSLKLVGF